jgi:hypothetical protein
MNPKASIDTRTRLTDETYRRCLAAALQFLRTNPSLRNSKLREITGIEYDQAISFFNRAVLEKSLTRKGCAGGTHYTIPDPSIP